MNRNTRLWAEWTRRRDLKAEIEKRLTDLPDEEIEAIRERVKSGKHAQSWRMIGARPKVFV